MLDRRQIGGWMEVDHKHHFLARALIHAAQPMLIVDKTCRLVWCNASYQRFSGFAEEALLGRIPKFLVYEPHRRDTFRDLWRTVFFGSNWVGELLEFTRTSQSVSVESIVTPLTDTAGRPAYFLITLRDISAHKTQIQQMSYLANHDVLTGLGNRGMFNSVLAHTIQLARRNKTECAVMFLDLDGFKGVNDTFGHHIGDALLIEVAKALRSQVRESDTVCRLSGDEFVILLHTVDGHYGAALIAQKIIERLLTPFAIENNIVRVGISIGIAIYPGHGDDAQQLVRHADAAMYQAKQAGKNRFVLFDDEAPPQLAVAMG